MDKVAIGKGTIARNTKDNGTIDRVRPTLERGTIASISRIQYLYSFLHLSYNEKIV